MYFLVGQMLSGLLQRASADDQESGICKKHNVQYVQMNALRRTWMMIQVAVSWPGHAGKQHSQQSMASHTAPLNWVVVKIMVPFWTPIIIRHLIFWVPENAKTDHNFDNHPCGCSRSEMLR